jgi:DNA-directed RNA polymerase specialized sigma24 family protein
MEMSLPEHHYKDLKLIALIEALRNCEDENVERVLKENFYNILQEKFFDRCHKITVRLYGGDPDFEAIRDDVFQETFLTAFDEIKTFEMKDHWDDQECEKVVLFWLGQITNRKLLKQRKADTVEKENLKNYLYHVISENSIGSVAKRKYEPTYDKVKFGEVWAKMNRMSKEILFLCLEHGTLSESNSAHLPDDVINDLIQKYSVTKSAIRQAKHRALDAIKSCKIEK